MNDLATSMIVITKVKRFIDYFCKLQIFKPSFEARYKLMVHINNLRIVKVLIRSI